jgi:long-chain fatty acid transport protein
VTRSIACLAAALAIGSSLAALTAHASPPFELAGSALVGGGFNARASGDNAAATYFNPARLARSEQAVELGWFVLNDAIDLTLYARDPAVDVPELALNEFEGQFPPVPTTWLQDGCDPATGGRCVSALPARPRQGAGSSGQTRAYQVVGLVSRIVDRYLTVGVYGMLPIGSFLQGRSFFVDEREQYFSNSLHPELYSDRLTAMSLAFGAGSQLLDWLALGAGLTLSLTNTADAATYVGNSGQIAESLQLSTEIEVSMGVAPHVGVLITPFAGLDISLTAHSPQKMDIVTGFSTFLPNGDLQRAERTATLAWMPWTFAAGAQFDFLRNTSHRLGVVATASYRLWSDYVDRQGGRPLQGYGWANTVALAFGLRHVFADRLSSFFDVNYEPTPVPPQTGRTNYVDNDRIGLGGGVSYQLPLGESGLALRLGLQGQVHVLPQREQLKLNPKAPEFDDGPYSQLIIDEWIDGAADNRGEVFEESFGLQTNNPGWPGFSSQGVIWAGGLSASLLY